MHAHHFPTDKRSWRIEVGKLTLLGPSKNLRLGWSVTSLSNTIHSFLKKLQLVTNVLQVIMVRSDVPFHLLRKTTNDRFCAWSLKPSPATGLLQDSTKRTMKYVVVGGGVAGVCCAEELCRANPLESVTIVSYSTTLKVRRNAARLV